MTTAFLGVCVLFGAVVVAAVLRDFARGRLPESSPLRQLAEQTSEHIGRWFAPFAIGVVVAHLSGVDERRSSVLSMAYVGSQLIYPVLLAAKADYIRVAFSLAGILATAALYVLASVR